MKKIVTTEMTEKSIIVTISGDRDATLIDLPFTLVNPRIGLQVASLLSSDPSLDVKSPDHEKAEN